MLPSGCSAAQGSDYDLLQSSGLSSGGSTGIAAADSVFCRSPSMPAFEGPWPPLFPAAAAAMGDHFPSSASRIMRRTASAIPTLSRGDIRALILNGAAQQASLSDDLALEQNLAPLMGQPHVPHVPHAPPLPSAQEALMAAAHDDEPMIQCSISQLQEVVSMLRMQWSRNLQPATEAVAHGDGGSINTALQHLPLATAGNNTAPLQQQADVSRDRGHSTPQSSIPMALLCDRVIDEACQELSGRAFPGALPGAFPGSTALHLSSALPGSSATLPASRPGDEGCRRPQSNTSSEYLPSGTSCNQSNLQRQDVQQRQDVHQKRQLPGGQMAPAPPRLLPMLMRNSAAALSGSQAIRPNARSMPGLDSGPMTSSFDGGSMIGHGDAAPKAHAPQQSSGLVLPPQAASLQPGLQPNLVLPPQASSLQRSYHSLLHHHLPLPSNASPSDNILGAASGTDAATIPLQTPLQRRRSGFETLPVTPAPLMGWVPEGLLPLRAPPPMAGGGEVGLTSLRMTPTAAMGGVRPNSDIYHPAFNRGRVGIPNSGDALDAMLADLVGDDDAGEGPGPQGGGGGGGDTGSPFSKALNEWMRQQEQHFDAMDEVSDSLRKLVMTI